MFVFFWGGGGVVGAGWLEEITCSIAKNVENDQESFTIYVISYVDKYIYIYIGTNSSGNWEEGYLNLGYSHGKDWTM